MRTRTMTFAAALTTLVGALCLLPGQSRADTYYDLTLTTNDGTVVAGTGWYEISGAAGTSGQIEEISISMTDPTSTTFDVKGSGAGSVAFNADGTFDYISANLGSGPTALSLNSAGYSYDETTGSVVDLPRATPLPGALTLFAGGLGVIGLVGRRRRKQKGAALAT